VIERWAFYQALRAMLDVARGERRETAFEASVQRGVHGVATQDDRRAERDLVNDTHATDTGRLRARTRRFAAAAWLQPALEREEGGAPVERSLAAAEAVRAVHEEVARLSEEQRSYIRLRFWNDVEVKEAAERMGISERTLRRRWVEVRELLEARLRARGILGVPEGFGEAVDAMEAAEASRR
jgi:RNA polymerase sigma factor (sigma-70 family)